MIYMYKSNIVIGAKIDYNITAKYSIYKENASDEVFDKINEMLDANDEYVRLRNEVFMKLYDVMI